jgi:hypothetical protein
MKIALCLLVALCVLSITMARGSGKRGKHGQGKHDDKPMDGPNPDHKPTGGQNPTGTPTGTPNPDHKQKMKDGSDAGKQKGRNGKGHHDD